MVIGEHGFLFRSGMLYFVSLLTRFAVHVVLLHSAYVFHSHGAAGVLSSSFMFLFFLLHSYLGYSLDGALFLFHEQYTNWGWDMLLFLGIAIGSDAGS